MSAAATPIDRATKLTLGATGLAILADGLQTTLRVSGALALGGLLVATVLVGRGTPATVSMPQPMGGTT